MILPSYCLFLHCDSSVLLPLSSLWFFHLIACFFTVILPSYCLFLHCDSSVLLPVSSLWFFRLIASFFTVILPSYCLFLHCAALWNALIVYSFVCVVVDWCLSLLTGLIRFFTVVSFFTGCVYGVFFLSLWSVVNFFTKCLCWTLSFIFLNCLWEKKLCFFFTVFFKIFFLLLFSLVFAILWYVLWLSAWFAQI